MNYNLFLLKSVANLMQIAHRAYPPPQLKYVNNKLKFYNFTIYAK